MSERMMAATTLFSLAYDLSGCFKREFVYRPDLVDRVEDLHAFGIEVEIQAEE